MLAFCLFSRVFFVLFNCVWSISFRVCLKFKSVFLAFKLLVKISALCTKLEGCYTKLRKEISGRFKHTKKLQMSKLPFPTKGKKDLIQYSKVLSKHCRNSWLNRYLIKKMKQNYAVSIATNKKCRKNPFHMYIFCLLNRVGSNVWCDENKVIFVEVLQPFKNTT